MHELHRYRESDAFSDLERATLDLVTGMTRTPADVPADLVERLAAELSPPALVELVTVIAFANHRGRWNIAFGIESVGLAEGAVCPLPERA